MWRNRLASNAIIGMFGFLSMMLLGVSCFGGASDHRSINLATDYDEIEARMRATVAFIEPDTERIFCSGFFVSGRTIVSAAHCFETSFTLSMPDGSTLNVPSGISPEGTDAPFITMDDLDMITNHVLGPLHHATVVYHNHMQDFVILELNVPAEDSPYVFELADESPRVGAQAYGIGHPLRLAWSFETGIISRVVRDPVTQNPLILQASVPVAGGNSGGPLLNSQGQLIGMALAFVERMPHLSIFISVEQIRGQMRMRTARQMIMAYEEQRTHSQPQTLDAGP